MLPDDEVGILFLEMIFVSVGDWLLPAQDASAQKCSSAFYSTCQTHVTRWKANTKAFIWSLAMWGESYPRYSGEHRALFPSLVWRIKPLFTLVVWCRYDATECGSIGASVPSLLANAEVSGCVLHTSATSFVLHTPGNPVVLTALLLYSKSD